MKRSVKIGAAIAAGVLIVGGVGGGFALNAHYVAKAREAYTASYEESASAFAELVAARDGAAPFMDGCAEQVADATVCDVLGVALGDQAGLVLPDRLGDDLTRVDYVDGASALDGLADSYHTAAQSLTDALAEVEASALDKTRDDYAAKVKEVKGVISTASKSAANDAGESTTGSKLEKAIADAQALVDAQVDANDRAALAAASEKLGAQIAPLTEATKAHDQAVSDYEAEQAAAQVAQAAQTYVAPAVPAQQGYSAPAQQGYSAPAGATPSTSCPPGGTLLPDGSCAAYGPDPTGPHADEATRESIRNGHKFWD